MEVFPELDIQTIAKFSLEQRKIREDQRVYAAPTGDSAVWEWSQGHDSFSSFGNFRAKF